MKTNEETRADIARRRLAQLTAAFEGRATEPVDTPSTPRHRLDPQHAKVLATVLTAVAVVTVWWLLSSRPQTTDAAPLAVTASSATPSSPPELVIDVEGKVRRPGIVTLPRGSRVIDAIKAAGGLKGKADTASLNMARKIDDGEQILVGATVPVAGATAVPGAPAVKVNLNTATMDQLDALPGVGPVTAKSILDWRAENGHFAKVEDLLDVKGIGEATLDDLRDLVTV